MNNKFFMPAAVGSTAADADNFYIELRGEPTIDDSDILLPILKYTGSDNNTYDFIKKYISEEKKDDNTFEESVEGSLYYYHLYDVTNYLKSELDNIDITSLPQVQIDNETNKIYIEKQLAKWSPNTYYYKNNYSDTIIGCKLVSKNLLDDYKKYYFKALEGFAKNFNTINGLILQFNKILGGDELYSRDVNNIYGLINKLKDEIRRLNIYDYAAIREITSTIEYSFNTIKTIYNSLKNIEKQADGTVGTLLTEVEATGNYSNFTDFKDIVGINLAEQEREQVLRLYTDTELREMNLQDDNEYELVPDLTENANSPNEIRYYKHKLSNGQYEMSNIAKGSNAVSLLTPITNLNLFENPYSSEKTIVSEINSLDSVVSNLEEVTSKIPENYVSQEKFDEIIGMENTVDQPSYQNSLKNLINQNKNNIRALIKVLYGIDINTEELTYNEDGLISNNAKEGSLIYIIKNGFSGGTSEEGSSSTDVPANSDTTEKLAITYLNKFNDYGYAGYEGSVTHNVVGGMNEYFVDLTISFKINKTIAPAPTQIPLFKIDGISNIDRQEIDLGVIYGASNNITSKWRGYIDGTNGYLYIQNLETLRPLDVSYKLTIRLQIKGSVVNEEKASDNLLSATIVFENMSNDPVQQQYVRGLTILYNKDNSNPGSVFITPSDGNNALKPLYNSLLKFKCWTLVNAETNVRFKENGSPVDFTLTSNKQISFSNNQNSDYQKIKKYCVDQKGKFVATFENISNAVDLLYVYDNKGTTKDFDGNSCKIPSVITGVDTTQNISSWMKSQYNATKYLSRTLGVYVDRYRKYVFVTGNNLVTTHSNKITYTIPKPKAVTGNVIGTPTNLAPHSSFYQKIDNWRKTNPSIAANSTTKITLATKAGGTDTFNYTYKTSNYYYGKVYTGTSSTSNINFCSFIGATTKYTSFGYRYRIINFNRNNNLTLANDKVM